MRDIGCRLLPVTHSCTTLPDLKQSCVETDPMHSRRSSEFVARSRSQVLFSDEPISMSSA